MSKWGGWAAFAAVVLAVLWASYRSTLPDRVERQRRNAPLDPALVEASEELLRRDLPGVSLGLTFQEALKKRSLLRRYTQGDAEGIKVFQESLDKTTSALYFFSAETGGIGRLLRVQIASNVKGMDAVVERVKQRQDRLGPPTGVWDCPVLPGQVPTRRYSFKHGAASAVEVYALVKEQAAITYYVGSTAQIRTSLNEAGCIATPPERAARFPVAVP
jgi:hypothetical protein